MTAQLPAVIGCIQAPGRKRARRCSGAALMIRQDSVFIQNWAWSWPANRRVMYNRASCDPSGKPWDAERRQVWWSDAQQKWVGNDVPDFKVDSKPSDHMGPFIMNPEGVGRIFAPLAAFADGPFPEHYEPVESPIANPLHPNQSNNPVAKKFKSDLDKLGTPDRRLQRRLHNISTN